MLNRWKTPFVGPSNKKQFRKYAIQLGFSAVVYRLGYETDHLDIEGVKAFRETKSARTSSRALKQTLLRGKS
jgi:hypothetical protein